MKNKLFLLGLSLIISNVLFSCIWSSSRTIKYGNDLTSPSEMIIVGKSNEGEIKTSLGEPSKKEVSGQGYRLIYETIWKRESNLYGTKVDEKIIRKQTLEIYVDEQGLVIDKKLRNESFDD
jgi:hypothetical protein